MIYSENEIKILREGGKRLAIILNKVSKKVLPGIKIFELNDYAEKLISEGGDEPAFLNYRPDGAKFSYPASLCVSVNDEVVHGISKNNERVLRSGDIVGLDLGIIHKGLITDMAITVGSGEIDESAKNLIKFTKKALAEGIKIARAGNTVGDIGFSISEVGKKAGLGVVDELGGHGVGKKVHEKPFIPNVGKKGRGEKLKKGMVLALEPMLNEGTKNVILDKDGYTFKTADKKRSAHFELTILITDGKAKILTC